MEILRPGGARITFEYAPGTGLSRVAGTGGNTLRLTTDAAGLVSRIDSSGGATVEYGYAGGQLTEVRVNGGPVTRYAYDGQKRLVRIDAPRSGASELAHDAKGRVLRRNFADGASERYDYEDATRTVRVTDPAGGVTSILRSVDGREEAIVDAMGRTTVLRRDDAGRLVSATGPTGLTASYGYDARGRLTVSGMPGFESRLTYVGDTELPDAITYSDGSRQTFEYDANRNLLALRQGAETIRAFRYLPNGQLSSLKERGKPERRLAYYPDGRLRSETEVGGRSWQFAYDQRGNLVRHTDALGRATELTYDAQDRLIALKDPAGADRYGSRPPRRSWSLYGPGRTPPGLRTPPSTRHDLARSAPNSENGEQPLALRVVESF
jgi:YD repeat-containing protein